MIIVIAASLGYLPSLSGNFILDDDMLLTDNSLIEAADGLYRFWCTTEVLDYWPVTNTTLWIEWRLWGMNSTGYRATNLILHIIDSLLIWIILRKLSIPGAFFAAMIFAVHPVNVESVAWIAQRKNLMAMLFFLMSILCYLRQFSLNCSDNAQRSRHSPCADPAHGVRGLLIGRWYWLSLAAFVLAMLSKGSVAVLPLLLLGIIWWRRTGTVPIFAPAKMGLSPSVSRWDLLRTAPFFLVAVVLAGVNVWFQTHGAGNEIRIASFAQRLLGAGGVVWFYLYKALLPLSLVFVYPQWNIQADNPLWWLPLLAAVMVTAVLWRYRRGWSRPFLFAWGFFCVSLIPVLGFVDVGFMQHSLVADHYQHLALIGVIVLAAAGWGYWRERVQGPARWATSAVAVVVVGALTLLTWRQSGLYRDDFTLYQATLDKNPSCWLAHNNLGIALAKADRVSEAIEHYQQAMRIEPNYHKVYYNMGLTLAKIGRLQEAIKYYEQALRIQPDYIKANFDLGIALADSGRFPEAIEYYKRALRLKPNDPYIHINMAIALGKTDRQPEAIEFYNQALRLKPNDPDIHINLAVALGKAGRQSEAIEEYKRALKLKPNDAEAHNNLGIILVNTGRVPEAIEYYKQALQIKAPYPEAHLNLGSALANVGRLQEAIENFEQALRIKPDYYEVYNELGIALAQTGRLPEAIERFRQALRIKPDYAEAYANLALAYVKTRQSSEAIATAEKALELARAKEQPTLAKQIEDWLNTYRASLSELPSTPPPSK